MRKVVAGLFISLDGVVQLIRSMTTGSGVAFLTYQPRSGTLSR